MFLFFQQFKEMGRCIEKGKKIHVIKKVDVEFCYKLSHVKKVEEVNMPSENTH